MQRLFIVLFFLSFFNIRSQKLDSLVKVAGALNSDTDRVNLFYSQGFANRALNPQYSYDCAKQAEKFAQQTSLPYYVAKANNLLGILFYRKNDFASALAYHKNALNLRTIIGDKKGIAMSQLNLGNIYNDLKKYDLAEEAYLKSLQINTELKELKQVGNCLQNLGTLKTTLKENELSKAYFTKALENARQRTDYELEAICLNNLAFLNIALERYDDAIANCVNSLKVKDITENEIEKADSYLNLAVAYFKKNDNVQAIANLKLADSIIKKYDYKAAEPHALKIWSDYYKSEKNFEEAFKYLSLYSHLKDSIESVNKNINLDNSFIEHFETKHDEGNSERKGFPFIYLNMLVLGLLVAIFIVLKTRK